MMLMPRRNFDLFDDFFDDGFLKGRQNSLMKTDIKENENEYVLDIDMPGFEKDNINMSLNSGYLEISAKVKKEENDDQFIRRERFYGECSRSFYVGDDVEVTDIDAEFKNGILKVKIPKKESQKQIEESKQIEIK